MSEINQASRNSPQALRRRSAARPAGSSPEASDDVVASGAGAVFEQGLVERYQRTVAKLGEVGRKHPIVASDELLYPRPYTFPPQRLVQQCDEDILGGVFATRKASWK